MPILENLEFFEDFAPLIFLPCAGFGAEDGAPDGAEDVDGENDGAEDKDGASLGWLEGSEEGAEDGDSLGWLEGSEEGAEDEDGAPDGAEVGAEVGHVESHVSVAMFSMFAVELHPMALRQGTSLSQWKRQHSLM